MDRIRKRGKRGKGKGSRVAGGRADTFPFPLFPFTSSSFPSFNSILLKNEVVSDDARYLDRLLAEQSRRKSCLIRGLHRGLAKHGMSARRLRRHDAPLFVNQNLHCDETRHSRDFSEMRIRRRGLANRATVKDSADGKNFLFRRRFNFRRSANLRRCFPRNIYSY